MAAKQLELIKDIHLRGQWKDNIPLFKLSCELKKVSADTGLQKMIEAIEIKIDEGEGAFFGVRRQSASGDGAVAGTQGTQRYWLARGGTAPFKAKPKRCRAPLATAVQKLRCL